MRLILMSLLSGTLFGIGLALSQMTNPDKVINFLDLAGNWDSSLLFVMFGALAVTLGVERNCILIAPINMDTPSKRNAKTAPTKLV